MDPRRVLVALATCCIAFAGVPAGALDSLDGGANPSLAGQSAIVEPRQADGSVDLVTDAPMVIETLDPSIDVDDPALLEQLAAIDAELERLTPTNPALELAPGFAAAVGGFVPSFDANVPNDVRNAVGLAIGSWSNALETPIPVVVQVSWTCLGDPGILGYAGASEIYRLDELPTSYGYPTALANALTGRDLNGGAPEIRVVLNSELASANACSFAADRWYTGSGTPPANQVDLLSVVLHEVAHGVGFLGSAWRQPGANQASLEPTPYAFDSLVHTTSGPLLAQPTPGSHLTSALSIDVGGSNLYSLYSPGFFVNGSSFSHFDSQTTTGNRGGSLMRPELGSGSPQRTIDAAVLGVLTQQGWATPGQPVAPILTATTSSRYLAVSLQPNLAQVGEAPVSYEVAARRGSAIDAIATIPAGQASVTLGPLYDGVSYDVTVTPIGRTGTGATSTATATMPNNPNQPRQVAASGTGTVQTIRWAAPVAASGTESYRVEQRLVGGAWRLVGQTAATSISTAALEQGVYQFRVRAERGGATGPYGASLLVGVSTGLVRPLPLDGEVGRLFSAYFLRQPDSTGYDYWTRQRAGGAALTAISSEFAASSEFTTRYGSLDDAEFIDLVYRNVLGRPADAAGLGYWVGELRNGRTRGQVMTGFSESPEFVVQTSTRASTSSAEGRISRLYFSFFLREPDAAGLDYWMTVERRGTSLEAIAVEMAQSAEFSAAYGNITDERFVEAVYNNVLTRSPDDAGRAHWLAQLRRGVDRGVMIVGFSESQEFILRTGTLP